MVIFILLIIFSVTNGLALHLPKVLNKDESQFIHKAISSKKIKPKKNELKKEYKRFFSFSLNNDNYLIIDRLAKDISDPGDDFGLTHSMSLEYSWKNKSLHHSLNFETALFSRATKSERIKGVKYITQIFREITSLEYTLEKIQSSFAYKVFSIEAGLINDDKPIKGLALWQQSGPNGDKGYHKLIGITTKLKNVSSGGKLFYGGASFTYGHLLPFGLKKYSFLNRIHFTSEAKLRLRTLIEGSSTSIIVKGHYNFIKHNGESTLSMNLQSQLNYYFKSRRTGTSTILGFQYQGQQFGVDLDYILPFGEQNELFYKYTDRDPLLNLSFNYQF